MAHTPPGNSASITINVELNGNRASSNIVIAIPLPTKIKSKGLNRPKINCPLFVLAGIK